MMSDASIEKISFDQMQSASGGNGFAPANVEFAAQFAPPATHDWYMTSIQSGFTVWQNAIGLGIDSFA